MIPSDKERLVDISDKPSDIQKTAIKVAFFTTNIDKFHKIDRPEFKDFFEDSLANLRKDYTKDEFIRSECFNQSWDCIQGEKREEIIGLLENYCAAEYSGFILYKELSYQLKNKDGFLAEGFSLMSRDEARHASLLNQSLLDFSLKPSLNFLGKKNRKYISLPFSWFIYSTYLSERISSCYYISIFNHLQSQPEYSIYPIFDFYRAWSDDENRHGDFFGAIMRSYLVGSNKSISRLVCKIYLITIFSMTYISYRNKSQFLETLGLDAHDYSISMIRKVNHSISRDLPVTLVLDDMDFFDKLSSILAGINRNKNIELLNQNLFLKLIKKIPNYLLILLGIARLSFTRTY